MVATEFFNTSNAEGFVGQIVLRPNNSMSWRATTYFLGTLMTISFMIAGAFTLNGYWVILPFTVLEMSVLGGCLYYIARRNHIQQVVRFSPEDVVIETGREHPEKRHHWQRFFTKILVNRGRYPWDPSRVTMRCRDEEQEIGSFLSSEEKDALVRDLRAMVAAADHSQRVGST